MLLQTGQVSRIKNREPGWEKDWAELCNLLVARLRKVCQYLKGIDWPDQDTRDDFVSSMLADYHRRALAGTLLSDFESTRDDADVLLYIASPWFLAKRAMGFLRRSSPCPVSFSVLMERQGNDQWDFPNGRKPVSVSTESENRLRAINHALTHPELAIPAHGRITSVVEQAGLQLYRCLDWQSDAHKRLLSHVVSILVDPSPMWPDRLSMLDHFHTRARESLEHRIAQKESEGYNQSHGVSPKKHERLRGQLQRLWLELAFYPLGAESLMCLMDITREDADQRRSRYKKSLPRLLPKLWEILAHASAPLDPDDQIGEDQ